MKQLLEPSPILFPLPVVLVSCGSDEPNVLTVAWAGTLCTQPPMVGIGVRPSRHSHRLLLETGDFVVNIPSQEQVKIVDGCGLISGKDWDKFSHFGLTAVPSQKVHSPSVAECPVSLECRIIHHLPLGTHDLFLGEVVQVQADAACINDSGKIDWDKVNPLAYCAHHYRSLGAELGQFGFSRKG